MPYESEFEKQWREEREGLEAEAKKMTMAQLRKDAEDLQHSNDWSGLRGREMTKLNVLKAEFKRRTKMTFYVERQVYP